MTQIILTIHLILAIGLVGVVLLQKSEGGGLGMGASGGGGGMGGLMTGRATADLLTRMTAVFAAGFMATSLTLAILANQSGKEKSILDQPAPAPVTQPAEPSVPTAPIAN